MRQLGIIASSIKKVSSGATMLLTTTSASGAWSPNFVNNSGPTLTWIATGAVTDTIVADDPTFDLSSSGGGDTNMSVSDIALVSDYRCWLLNLTSLDVSAMAALTHLECDRNDLTTLVVNTDLPYLECHTNSLTSLDVSLNTSLATLHCETNSLTSLILGGGVLITLNCFNNSITSLDTSSESLLSTFNCNSCSLTSLTVGGGALTSFVFWGNAGLSSLDVSGETSITLLWGFNCGLTNGITTAGASSLINNIRVQANSFTATSTNQLLADLVASGVINGNLHYRNNETGQGVTDRAQLITDGWSITNYAS